MNTVDKQKLMEWIKNRRIALEGMVSRYTGYHERYLSGQHRALVDVEWELQEGRFDASELPEPEGLREPVRWFAELMEDKLRENDYKGGWDNENIYWLWERLREETSELLAAIDATRDLYADPINIALEAADIANFAMMIADLARKKIEL